MSNCNLTIFLCNKISRCHPWAATLLYETLLQHIMDLLFNLFLVMAWNYSWRYSCWVSSGWNNMVVSVDYRELNKKTQKDTYPLPLIDEVQDKLANFKIFSILYLQCGYWQMPVNPQDYHKTAFSLDQVWVYSSLGVFHLA